MSILEPLRRGGRHLFSVLRVLQVRLRFLMVLLLAFLIVGKWDSLRNYWDKLTRSRSATSASVSSDIEYWCPMCPGVSSDWPSKCPVCNMALVQRKRGEAVPLPDGVLARMQLSPYRMTLAGIQTSAVGYRPLTQEVVFSGRVDYDERRAMDLMHLLLRATVFDKDLPFLQDGLKVSVTAEAFPDRGPWTGLLRGLKSHAPGDAPALRVGVEIDNPRQDLRPGLWVTAKAEVRLAEVEPFRSQPRGTPLLRPGEPRQLYHCPDHPDVVRDQPGRCPRDQKELESHALATNQKLGWWCPMHPRVTADKPGCECADCKGMKLLPRVVAYSPPGEVLAVPDSAVLDTGTKKMVYIERMPGMFDGIEVVLGPRCGDFYPVIRGLEAGQKVATAGAFLIDAETRLNPSLAVGYFGAGGAERRPAEPSPKPISRPALPDLMKLPAVDRELALRQRVCPVTGEPLGSMGVPPKVVIEGKAVFLCCEGCEEELRKNPKKYLAKLK